MDWTAFRCAGARIRALAASVLVMTLLMTGALTPLPTARATGTLAAAQDSAPSAPSTAPSSTTTPTSVPSQTPGSQQAKIIVRAGGDQQPDGSVTGLPGVEFVFYRTTDADDLDDGSLVARCTTGADGRCGVIVKFTAGSAVGHFYARQVAAPEGWTHAETWGASTDYVRHNTGELTGGTTIELPDGNRSWPNVRANPTLDAPVCEPAGTGDEDLDVAFVVDVSNSINRHTSQAVFEQYKQQATELVDAFQGTPTTMTVYTFATAAPAAGSANGTLGATSVSTPAGADSVKVKISGLTRTPNPDDGYVSWDEGLAQTIGKDHDAVILLTDGGPSDSRSTHYPNRGYGPTLHIVEEAVHAANGIKAGGARLMAVGVTDDGNSDQTRHQLSLLTGPLEPQDYATARRLDRAGELLWQAGTALVRAVHGDCTTLTVSTRTADTPASTVPAAGRALTVDLGTASSATPRTTTTGQDGTSSFTVRHAVDESAQRVTVTQAQESGYALRPANGAHATCTANDTPLAVTNTDGGFAVDVPRGAAASCTIVNQSIGTAYTPGPAETRIMVRAGGDRRRDGSVAGLRGASFDLYRSGSATPLEGGTRVGRCTTADDGTCAVVIGLADASQGTAFHAVQTAAPAGWRVAQRWGGSDDLVRYSTGKMLGGTSASLPRNNRHWPNVRTNPALPRQCGLDIDLVYDLSNSITRDDYASEFETYRTAGTGIIDSLEGTPSRLALHTYAAGAPAAGPANGTLGLTSVARKEGADTVRTAITSLTATPSEEDGWTNWDLGLAQLPADLDVVVFLTDGAPSLSRSTRQGGLPTLLMVEEAVHSANAVKASGAHLFVVGAGPAHDDANRQRLTLLSDDTRLSDFHELGDLLNGVTPDDCQGTVNIVKDVRATPGGGLAPGGGWEFTPAAAGAGTVPVPVTTDADGTASFTVDLSAHAPAGRTVTITETPRAGYAIEQQDGHNAVCTTSDGAPVTTADVEHGFTVQARHDAVITCRIINAALPRPGVSIVKTSALDRRAGIPIVASGTHVTWSYRVTNTGNVPLRNLRVTNDRGVDVTCPTMAGSPASGNPIAVLAVGESVTCSATGQVIPVLTTPSSTTSQGAPS